MFITTTASELVLPKEFAPSDCRYWDTAELPAFFPWYVVTHALSPLDPDIPQTTLAGSDIALRQLCEAFENHVMSVSRLSYRGGSSKSWESQQVQEIWLSSDIECAETGMLLLALKGTSCLVTSDGDEVAQRSDGRRLLTRMQC